MLVAAQALQTLAREGQLIENRDDDGNQSGRDKWCAVKLFGIRMVAKLRGHFGLNALQVNAPPTLNPRHFLNMGF